MSSFTYYLNIPNAPDDPADDQPKMLQNTNSISSIIAVDHFTFNVGIAPGGQNNPGGKHSQVQLPVAIVDFPAILGQGTAYSKAIGFGMDAQLFWRFANPAIQPLQITGNQFTADTAGTVPLMAGLQMTWGQKALPNLDSLTGPVTFDPVFNNNCFAVFVSLISKVGGSTSSDNTIAVREGSITAAGFRFDYNGNAGSYTFFQWVAIGN